MTAKAFHHIRSMPLSKAQGMLCRERPETNTAVISVVTPGDPLPALDLRSEPWLVIELADGALMSSKDARRIAEFVTKCEGQERALFVHCLMGVSRSPSIANGIAKYYGMDVWHMAGNVHPMSHIAEVVRYAIAEVQL